MRLLALLFGVLMSGPAAAEPGGLAHDAYVWQRQGTPEVAAAMAQTADLMHAWRVLGGQSDRGAALKAFPADIAALDPSGRPVVMVVRIDGPQAVWHPQDLPVQIAALAQDWRARGVALAGVELDHDSATVRLPEYARLITAVRDRLDPGLRLSVTALPTWLPSPDFDLVLAAVDEVVLQVHGVDPAPQPLFEVQRALGWVKQLSRRTAKPFRVALPAYGVGVVQVNGRVVAVEAEAALLAGGDARSELVAEPADVAAFLSEMAHERPGNLVGVVWFRLPTARDRRAWSLATLRAVIAGQPLRPDLRLDLVANDTPGLLRVVLVNRGTVDARLPRALHLPPHCTPADGVNGYSLDRGSDGATLRRNRDGMLRGQARLDVGWMRCAASAEDIDVIP